MTEAKKIIGCKLLTAEGTSLREKGRVQYLRGRWVTVLGNGAYVAITGGITRGGIGPTLAYMECEEPTGAEAIVGVRCYRRVRWLDPCPEKISPKLRGNLARSTVSLTHADRMGLARASIPKWRGLIAAYASGLTREDRMDLAQTSTPEWRGAIACYASGLTREDRMDLAQTSTPKWRGEIALYAPGLADGDRATLRAEGKKNEQKKEQK